MDDEAIIRETTEAMCRALGYEALSEKDGLAAIRRFRKRGRRPVGEESLRV